MGALSPLDPLYKEKLRDALKKKGFSYKIIDKAMELAGVDNQIAQAQQAQAKQDMQQSKAAFVQALQAGDYATAGAELANIASRDKTQAAMLASYYPSFKDSWNVNVKRQDAATNFDYNRILNNDKFEQNVKLKGVDYQYKVNAALAEYQMKNAAEKEMIQWRMGAAIQAGVDPQTALLMAMGRSSGKSGGSGSGSSSGTSAEEKLGAKYRSLFNDANELMLSNGTEAEVQQAALNAENAIVALNEAVEKDISDGKLTDEEDKTSARNMIFDLRYRQCKNLGKETEAAKWFKQMTPDYRAKFFPNSREWTAEDQKAKEEVAAAEEEAAKDKSSIYKGMKTGGTWYTNPGGYGSYLSQFGRY